MTTARGPWNQEKETRDCFAAPPSPCPLASNCCSQSVYKEAVGKYLCLVIFLDRQKVEGKPLEEHDELDETALGGIPSLDFRPVLDLFAPTGKKFQMSPCGECGGTLEVGYCVTSE